MNCRSVLDEVVRCDNLDEGMLLGFVTGIFSVERDILNSIVIELKEENINPHVPILCS